MSFRITLPVNIGLVDWADQITYDLDPYGSFGKLQSEMHWQDWAANLMNHVTVDENLPSPYQFDNWQDWAERFCQSLA